MYDLYHNDSTTQVAIKIIDKTDLDPGNLAKVYREVEVMKLVSQSESSIVSRDLIWPIAGEPPAHRQALPGHGDQEHALPRLRVRPRRGDIWWEFS